ncbi:MAG: tetratricopeptide repeat protein [Acidobacteria bacterium]|nr:tetratricopeptide repeat protein [Acidobacteriota bacterium]
MRAESIVFALAGVLFGLITGWVLGSQQAGPVSRSAAPPVAAAPAQTSAPQATAAPAVLDQSKVQSLRAVAEQNPKDAEPRVQLGNLFFDAERYSDAITWYEAALTLTPRDANVSTDLGVAYYYTSQPDRAIQQFQHSLSLDPRHTKTLLNLGIVKAFGKQDLDGAAEAWKQVIALAPDTPEGQAARRALQGLQKAHPGGGTSGNG